MLAFGSIGATIYTVVALANLKTEEEKSRLDCALLSGKDSVNRIVLARV